MPRGGTPSLTPDTSSSNHNLRSLLSLSIPVFFYNMNDPGIENLARNRARVRSREKMGSAGGEERTHVICDASNAFWGTRDVGRLVFMHIGSRSSTPKTISPLDVSEIFSGSFPRKRQLM